MVSLFGGSCQKVIYNVMKIPKLDCNESKEGLVVKFQNNGKIGVSNISLKIIDEWVNFGGIKPGETTCSYKIDEISKHPEFKVYVLNSKGIGTTITNHPIDIRMNELYNKGKFTVQIELSSNNSKIEINEFRIQENNSLLDDLRMLNKKDIVECNIEDNTRQLSVPLGLLYLSINFTQAKNIDGKLLVSGNIKSKLSLEEIVNCEIWISEITDSKCELIEKLDISDKDGKFEFKFNNSNKTSLYFKHFGYYGCEIPTKELIK